MIKKHTFNMIEIVLALLVISIGIMSIMGLVPIGAKAHIDAMNYNRAADLASDALHETAAELQNNWSYTGPSPNPAVHRIQRAVYDQDGNFVRNVVDYEVDIYITIESGQKGFYYDADATPKIQMKDLDDIKLIKARAVWPPDSDYPQEAHFALEVKRQ